MSEQVGQSIRLVKSSTLVKAKMIDKNFMKRSISRCCYFPLGSNESLDLESEKRLGEEAEEQQEQ